jgi:hypothetical protein
MDSWESREAYAEFRKKWAAEYAALDQTCECLMLSERHLGEFQ